MSNDDVLPDSWFKEAVGLLNEHSNDVLLQKGVRYHALCMICMFPIRGDLWAYGHRCGCLAHYDCVMDREHPEQCMLHYEGSTMVTYSQDSTMCILNCGECGERYNGVCVCKSCLLKIRGALERAVKLLWAGKPRLRYVSLFDMGDEKHGSHNDIASGAPIETLYKIMMTNCIWPSFFADDNVVDEEEFDLKALKPSCIVHPLIHVTWDVVHWMLLNDRRFYYEAHTQRAWLVTMWIEADYLKLPVQIHDYPDIMYSLSAYKACTQNISKDDIKLINTLINVHFKSSPHVTMMDSNHIRKNTKYNIYSPETLLRNVQNEEFGDITLCDVYAEDMYAQKFIDGLVENGDIVIINNRLYPKKLVGCVEGLEHKMVLSQSN